MWHRRREIGCISLFALFNLLSFWMLLYTGPVKTSMGALQESSRGTNGVSNEHMEADDIRFRCKVLNTTGTDEPILTLFTTIKDLRYREHFHMNTLNNWALLTPWVQPVLFVQDPASEAENASSWTHKARSLGWRIEQITRTSHGTPILKAMFQQIVQSGFESHFVGYANADILFDTDLVNTLKSVREAHPVETNQILVSGRRKNVDEEVIMSTSNVFCPDVIMELAVAQPLYIDKSADYFIFSKSGFPWTEVPDFIVGRIGFDTWLLAMANNWGVTLVDASNTINAVHQTGKDGITAGEDINEDSQINRDMIGKWSDIGPGKHKCARYESVNADGAIEIRYRNVPDKCAPRKQS